jgi:thiamine biosynthesis protein ThiS
MQLEINGEPRDFPDGLTVASLVAHLGMKADRVAVELNRDIVPRNNWDATSLKDGDKLEIVHFVGGGTASGGRAEGSTVAEVDNRLSLPLIEDGTWVCPSCGARILRHFVLLAASERLAATITLCGTSFRTPSRPFSTRTPRSFVVSLCCLPSQDFSLRSMCADAAKRTCTLFKYSLSLISRIFCCSP